MNYKDFLIFSKMCLDMYKKIFIFVFELNELIWV